MFNNYFLSYWQKWQVEFHKLINSYRINSRWHDKSLSLTVFLFFFFFRKKKLHRVNCSSFLPNFLDLFSKLSNIPCTSWRWSSQSKQTFKNVEILASSVEIVTLQFRTCETLENIRIFADSDFSKIGFAKLTDARRRTNGNGQLTRFNCHSRREKQNKKKKKNPRTRSECRTTQLAGNAPASFTKMEYLASQCIRAALSYESNT